jgi:hypothetical protein
VESVPLQCRRVRLHYTWQESVGTLQPTLLKWDAKSLLSIPFSSEAVTAVSFLAYESLVLNLEWCTFHPFCLIQHSQCFPNISKGRKEIGFVGMKQTVLSASAFSRETDEQITFRM